MYIGLHVKYPLFMAGFNEASVFQVSENIQITNFTKIQQVRAELFHADRQTDRQTGKTDIAKLIVAFSQFGERA
jgi:hypothetical protein